MLLSFIFMHNNFRITTSCNVSIARQVHIKNKINTENILIQGGHEKEKIKKTQKTMKINKT